MFLGRKRWIGAALLIAGLVAGRSWIKARFYVDHMERDERLTDIQVPRVVQALPLDGDEKVADIGAGSGLFSRALAGRLTGGTVYAVDINPYLLEHIEQTTREAGITNVQTVLATEDDPKLPQPVDVVFLFDTLHYVDDPAQYLKVLHGNIVDGGRLVIVNFFRNWPPMSNEFDRKQLETWMGEAGFRLVAQHDFLPDRYYLIFARQAGE